MLQVKYANKPIKKTCEIAGEKYLLHIVQSCRSFSVLFQIQRALSSLSIYDILKLTKYNKVSYTFISTNTLSCKWLSKGRMEEYFSDKLILL